VKNAAKWSEAVSESRIRRSGCVFAAGIILSGGELGVGALTFSFVSPEEARQWVKDYYRTIEHESEPIGCSESAIFAITCRFSATGMRSHGADRAGKLRFFLYGLGTTASSANTSRERGYMERVQDQSA